MLGQVARWGNSLGIRIPKDIACQVGLTVGAKVEIEAAGTQVVISVARPRYRLTDLLVGMTPEGMHDAFEWGDDVGREAVE